MIINAIKCKKCGDIIYSRCTHDFNWCSCKSCAIDGGFRYTKIVGNIDNWESMQINILESKTDSEVKKILYDDWNSRKNEYGRLSNYE